MNTNKEEILTLKSQLSPAKRVLLEKRLRGEVESNSRSNIISRRSSTAPPPLSFAQQRLWFLQQLEPDNPFYNEHFAIQLTGLLDVAALEQSLNGIVQRHEALRTTFEMVEGQAVQVIAPSLTLTLPVVNLYELPETEHNKEVQKLVVEQTQYPFDLLQGPLLRSTLLQLSEQKHILLLTAHHIIGDGWSMGVFIRELSALYQAFSTGKPSPLPELPIQYADFALWQRQQLQGEKLESQLSYWKQQLKNAPPLLQLPTDRPRPPVQTYRGAKESFRLPKSLTESLKGIGKKAEATLFMTLLAAFKLLLYRYSGQDDIIVGSPIANRNRAEIEGLIGCFVNTLVLRTDFSGNPTFEELLGRVRQVTMAAYEHQDLPFEKLVEELQPERDVNYNPLFQVSFTLQNTPRVKFELPGLTITPFEVENTRALFDLRLDITETDSGIEGFWEYNTDLFDAATISRMSGHFQTLLEAIVENPQQRVDQLPLLSETEQHQLLVEWNNTESEYPCDQCIHQLFEEQVERTPDAVAVVFENQQLTYQQLNQRANQLAHYLLSLGVKPDVLVGICVERSLEMVVGLLGILKAGGAYVPLDPNYPQQRLSYMLADSGVEMLLTQSSLLASLPEHQAQVVCLDTDWEAIEQYQKENLDVGVSSDNLAYVIYTSGSTGQPKGVMNTHQGICNRLLWMQQSYQLTRSDRIVQKTPFSFDVSVWEFFWPLLNGARIVVALPEGHKDSTYLVNLISQQQITTIHFVPSMLQAFLQEPNLENCSGLKQVFCSGEALPFELTQRFFSKLECELHNLYGPTEAAIDATFWHCQPQDNLQIVPIGRPIANTQIYILDKHLQPVPIGVLGELYIGGDGLARGYLNRPELTSEKFIPNPFEQSNCNSQKSKLYKTGDLARYLPDGNIEFLGRIDHQVKIRGFRIELGEIEAVLNTHPQIQQTVVIAREDLPGNKRLVAYIVTRDELLTNNQLREFLWSKLPEYMVPSAFVTLDTLPLTPNGKVDRKVLPAPDGEISREHEYVAPRTPSEEIIANIFASVLGVQNVGIHDNFFELGGHSLLATQLISRLRVALDVEIPLRAVFESPTVAQLEQTLTQLRTTNSGLSLPPIQPRTHSEQLPLSWAQERLWFLDQLEGSSATYNMPGAIRVSGNLDINALQQALSEIVRRHEVLRTSFQTVNGTPIQVIHPEATLKINVVDLEQLEVTERETVLHQQVQLEAITPFNLEIAPLIRCSLLQLSATEYVLLLTMHHIVSDGWSIGVFIEELSSLYQAFGAGEPSPLAELPIQYADFALWQRQWLSGEVLEAQLKYWQQQLQGAPELLQLPTDRPRPSVQTYRGTTQSFSLNSDLTQKLQTLSRESGTTLFMTLLAAFAILLYRYSGQEDIVIGSPIANRHHQEVESLIGFFVNTLVLRTRFEDNPSMKNLLARVRETTLKAYEHQDVSFEQVVEVLQPQRSLSHSPLFQVMFILQNAPMAEVKLPGVTLTQLERESTIAKLDLTLSITETSQGLVGEWEYNTDLFDGSTIERMAVHFQNLLSAIVENPQQQVSQLPLLSEAERHQLLTDWNDTTTKYSSTKCIHQLFEEQVEKTLDAIAVVFENQQLTYQQLNQRANQLAHHLLSLGVKPEVLVGICTERSLEMVVGLLGILKAGGTYVPLDSNYPQERLSYMLADSGVEVLLTQQSLLESLPEHQAIVVCLDTDWEAIEQHQQQNLDVEVSSDNLAYVIYTSGSTGKPKGVMNTHRGIHNRLLWMQQAYQLTCSDRVLQKTPFSFDVSVWEFFWPLLTGARLVVALPEGHKDRTYLINLISQQQITTIHFVPSMLQVFLQAPNLEDCRCLQRVFCSGEALSFELTQRFFSQLNCELHNLYGPTEAAIDVTFWQCQPQDNLQLVPIGRPIANTQIYILDKHLQPVPIGVPGELYIGGDSLARGYLNRPELTQEKFIPNPFDHSLSKRLYKTGDLARYLSDGNIEFLGRIDHQVKIRGFRIELGEIEAALSQHSQVREAVVIARENPSGDKCLGAYIVTKDESLTTNQWREFLQQKLPVYMMPSAFVTLDTLPLTPNGKVDRKALPAPHVTNSPVEKDFVLPRNSVEEVLAKIWVEVLSLEQVSVYSNFFELGGHSLLATQVISRIEKAFEVELPLRLLFELPTVAGLAEAIENTRNAELKQKVPPIKRVPRDSELPLSFAQARLWFLDQLEAGSFTYNTGAAVRLIGSLNVAALEQSLNEIVRRHETLRTTFSVVGGQTVQIIAPTLKVKLPIVDLRKLPAIERDAEVQRLAIEEAQQPFNLARCPLLRGTLLHISEKEHIWLFTMHHIISDGWSIGVLIRELAVLYEAFCAGKPSPLSELPIQYADFAVWQRQWLQGEVLKNQLAYWKQQLGTNLPILKLPTDRPRESVQTSRGATHSFQFPSNLSKALQELSRQEEVTLFMTLLASFQVLLQRYTNQDDIVVGTDVANRNRAETESLIGFFVNLLVLRTDLSGNPSFRELLKRVREVALGAYAHQDLPFEQLVAALQPDRQSSHTPLFQVLFVLQNAPMPALELPGLTLSLLEVEPETTKFDLGLFLTETEQGLEGYWQYNADLFESITIKQMSTHFETLLKSIMTQPDTRINNLEMLTDAEKEQQALKKRHHKTSKLKKLMTVKTKALELSPDRLVKTDYLQSGAILPFVITPDIEDLNITEWAKSNRSFIETNLLQSGAILFRNFGVNSIADFESFAEAICPGLFGEYGDLPREGVSGKVYGSTPYPQEQAILFHNESSHMHCWPQKIWFFCVQPAQQGGETPIVDCRKILKLLDTQLRERLERKQLMYVRNYTDGLDVSWQDFFHTSDKATVEDYCHQAGIEFEWLPGNGLRTRKVRPAITKHPKTGEKVFFNQLQLHHVSCLEPAVRESLLSMFGEENLPRNVYYGDGSPIEDSVMSEIGAIYQEAQVSFPWQQGDIVMLDNMLTAHGRNPYVGSRKIVVAMGEMIHNENL